MPQSIPKGLTREHVLKALADLDAGIDHPFGKPTGYELVHEGKRYAPKAVIGIAFRHLTGQMLQPADFSGGEAPGQANYELRRLGFKVESKARRPRRKRRQRVVGRGSRPADRRLLRHAATGPARQGLQQGRTQPATPGTTRQPIHVRPSNSSTET